MQSPRRSTERDAFEVAPQNERLYFVDNIQIGTAGFPFDRYPSVEVQLRYADPANGIDLDDTFLLTKDNHEITWKRFRMDEALDGFQIRRVFHAEDNRDRVIDWTELDQERFTIRNPVPKSRTVQVVPAVNWGIVSMVFVEMSYQDQANGVFQSETLFFMNSDQDRGPEDLRRRPRRRDQALRALLRADPAGRQPPDHHPALGHPRVGHLHQARHGRAQGDRGAGADGGLRGEAGRRGSRRSSPSTIPTAGCTSPTASASTRPASRASSSTTTPTRRAAATG